MEKTYENENAKISLLAAIAAMDAVGSALRASIETNNKSMALNALDIWRTGRNMLETAVNQIESK